MQRNQNLWQYGATTTHSHIINFHLNVNKHCHGPFLIDQIIKDAKNVNIRMQFTHSLVLEYTKEIVSVRLGLRCQRAAGWNNKNIPKQRSVTEKF